MSLNKFIIRNAKPEEFDEIGNLMVTVYAQLEGFPKEDEQPEYYKMLGNIGKFTEKENAELLVAMSNEGKLVGGLVYFSDMKNYGSGGMASEIKNTSGFRLLAVDPFERGKGIAKLLCAECIKRAKELNQKQLIIHSTQSMKVARKMYEKLGFVRYKKLDFIQGNLPVFGFKLKL